MVQGLGAVPGLPWPTLACPGLPRPWLTLASPGLHWLTLPLPTLASLGLPWATLPPLAYTDLHPPSFTLAYTGLHWPTPTLAYLGLPRPWLTLAYHGMPWPTPTLAYPGLPWLTLAHTTAYPKALAWKSEQLETHATVDNNQGLEDRELEMCATADTKPRVGGAKDAHNCRQTPRLDPEPWPTLVYPIPWATLAYHDPGLPWPTPHLGLP